MSGLYTTNFITLVKCNEQRLLKLRSHRSFAYHTSKRRITRAKRSLIIGHKHLVKVHRNGIVSLIYSTRIEQAKF